jgi:phage tail-like protein
MTEQPAAARVELVATFRFWVRLTRSADRMATRTPPPDLRLPAAGKLPTSTAAAPPGRRAAPPVVAAPGGGGDGTALDQLGGGGFQECSGLELDVEARDYVEGARNDGVVRRIGRVKATPIVLKRGMFVPTPGGYVDTALWDWLQGMVDGATPPPRYDGKIEVRDAAQRRVVARWSFARALPLKVSGPGLNGKTGDIAIEELHLGHEGLRLEGTP